MPFMVDDAALQAALDAAPDGNSASSENWGNAIVTQGGGVTATIAELRKEQRRRGQQKHPLKVPTTIRLDAELLAFLKATGPGWQTRVNEVLCKYMRSIKANISKA